MSRLVFIYPQTKLYFNVIEIAFVTKWPDVVTGKITNEDNVVIKTLRLEKSGAHDVRRRNSHRRNNPESP